MAQALAESSRVQSNDAGPTSMSEPDVEPRPNCSPGLELSAVGGCLGGIPEALGGAGIEGEQHEGGGVDGGVEGEGMGAHGTEVNTVNSEEGESSRRGVRPVGNEGIEGAVRVGEAWDGQRVNGDGSAIVTDIAIALTDGRQLVGAQVEPHKEGVKSITAQASKKKERTRKHKVAKRAQKRQDRQEVVGSNAKAVSLKRMAACRHFGASVNVGHLRRSLRGFVGVAAKTPLPPNRGLEELVADGFLYIPWDGV